MWLGSDLIGIVLPSETPSYKPDTAEHRFCMRHLYANFRKRFSGQKLKILMWKAARQFGKE